MKKLKLNLDDLRVESFETSPAAPKDGTVHGYAETYEYTICGLTCDATCAGQSTCDLGCGGQSTTLCGGGGTEDFTCNDYSCQYTSPGCSCNTEGPGCTYGPQVTCAVGGPHGGPCPQ